MYEYFHFPECHENFTLFLQITVLEIAALKEISTDNNLVYSKLLIHLNIGKSDLVVYGGSTIWAV